MHASTSHISRRVTSAVQLHLTELFPKHQVVGQMGRAPHVPLCKGIPQRCPLDLWTPRHLDSMRVCCCALGTWAAWGSGTGQTQGLTWWSSRILAGLSCFPGVPARRPPLTLNAVGTCRGGRGNGPRAQALKFFSLSPLTAEPQPADRGAGPPGCHHPQADRCHHRSRPE